MAQAPITMEVWENDVLQRILRVSFDNKQGQGYVYLREMAEELKSENGRELPRHARNRSCPLNCVSDLVPCSAPVVHKGNGGADDPCQAGHS